MVWFSGYLKGSRGTRYCCSCSGVVTTGVVLYGDPVFLRFPSEVGVSESRPESAILFSKGVTGFLALCINYKSHGRKELDIRRTMVIFL